MRGRHLTGLFAILTALALFSTGGSRNAPAGSENDGLSAAADYTVRADSRETATAEAHFTMKLHGNSPKTVPLLPAAVALRSVTTSSDKIRILQENGRYTARLPGRGEYEVVLGFSLQIAERAGVRSVNLPLMDRAACRVSVHIAWPGMAFNSYPAVPLEMSSAENASVAVFYPAGLGSLEISWFPQEMEIEPEAVFSTREKSVIDLAPGIARRNTALAVNMQRGRLDRIEIKVPAGLDILNVSCRIFDGPVFEHIPTTADIEAGEAPFRMFDGDSVSWHLEGAAPDRRLIVQFRRAVTHLAYIRITSEQAAADAGEDFALVPFDPLGADRRHGLFDILQVPEHTVTTAALEGMNRIDRPGPGIPDEPARFALRPPSREVGLVYEYHTLPAVLRVAVRPLPSQITASVLLHARLQERLVDIEARVSCRIENRAVDVLHLEMDEELLILAVEGDRVAGWETDNDILEIHLSERVRGELEFTLTGVQHLRRVDGVLIPQVRILGAVRQDGAVGVGVSEDLGLVHRDLSGYRQVDPLEIDAWLRARRPALAYTYQLTGDRDERLLAVSTRLILPELLVQGQGVAIIGEESVQEEYMFTCHVSRRPLFRLLIRLPRGLTPINLFGEQITDWEFHPESRLITVRLDRGLLGVSQVRLFCERRIDEDDDEVITGGAAVPGAEHFTGWFGVGTDANLDIRPIRTESAALKDIRAAPALISTHDDVKMAFEWSGDEWGIVCKTEVLEPRITAETDTALVFGAGMVRASTLIRWNVGRARVQELFVRLPAGASLREVEGAGVQSYSISDGLRAVRLADPVAGEYELTVHYEMHADTVPGRLLFPGIGLPQAHRQSGRVSVYLSDPRLEVSVENLRNVRRSDLTAPVREDGPAALGTFSYSGPERSMEFAMRGHDMAAEVRLRAEQLELATVMKREGRSVSYMRCRLLNAGEQYFSLKLPEGAILWGTYIEGEPVRPIHTEGGAVSVPLLDAPRDVPFELGVIWSQPSARLGIGASVHLPAPELNLPAQAVHWNLYVPQDYQVVSSGGNMVLTRTVPWYEQGLPGIARERAVAAWPAVRTILVLGVLIVAAVSVAGFFALSLFYLARWCAARITGMQPAKPETGIRQWVLKGLLICLAVVLLASMLMPAMSRSRSQARRASSSAKLYQLGLAITMYRHDHGGRLPPSLEALLESGHLENEALLISPATGTRYRYAGPLDPQRAAPDTPIAWDPLEDDPGAIVLFLDSSVRDVRRDDRAFHDAVRSLSEVAAPAVRDDFAMSFERPAVPGRAAMDAPATLGLERARVEKIKEPAPAEPEFMDEELLAADLARQRMGERERERLDRAARDIELAESYRRRGDLDGAERQYRQALEIDPESEEARRGLRRIGELQESDALEDAMQAMDEELLQLEEWEDAARVAETEKSIPLAGMLTYREQLERELDARWRDGLSMTGEEEQTLAVVSGEEPEALLPSGARIERRANDLVISGPERAVNEAGEMVSRLQGRMVEEVREITRARRQLQAEMDARRRAEARRRQDAVRTLATDAVGTVAGSRGAGALPIEIAFPGFGTEVYPFHMDYAGTVRPRIEVTCLRAGAAMVLQGIVAGLLWLIVSLVAWRMPRAGLGLGAALTVVLVFMLQIGEGAAMQYVVMGLAGLALAAPVLLVRNIRPVFRRAGL